MGKINIYSGNKVKKIYFILPILLLLFFATFGFMFLDSTSFGLKHTYKAKIEEVKKDYILLNKVDALDLYDKNIELTEPEYIRIDIRGNKDFARNKDVYTKGVEIKFKTTDKIKLTDDFPPKIMAESIKYIKKY